MCCMNSLIAILQHDFWLDLEKVPPVYLTLKTPFTTIVIHPKTLFGGVYRSQLVGRSIGQSVAFCPLLFLINYWTNFIQTSQVNSVSSRDVHVKCWLWFIDFSVSYGPFMKFFVRSFSHQLMDRFGSNYTNRLSIKQRCAYPILVMVYLGFMELWPFDDSRQISFKLHG